jgi:hypothetical protein
MCQGAVRQCNLISRIDRQGAEQRCFRVANGAVEMPLGIIRDVTVTVGDLTTVMDATVCAAETTDILLGVKFLAQVDGVLRIHPPVLEMTNSHLQKCSVAVDYSGDSRLHQFDQYAFSCVDQSYHYLSTCSSNEAQLQYADDSDSRQVLSHYNYVMSATEYAGTADLARRTSRPRHQRDVSDWMFRPDLFRAIQAKFGPFTIDACCDSAGANAQLPEYWSAPPGGLLLTEGCLRQNWANKSVYCHPDFHQIDDVLRHYISCYKRAPAKTRALFILPDWPGTSWFDTMWHNPDFMLVSYYPAGSQLFSAPGLTPGGPRTAMGPTRWGIMVVLHQQRRPNIPLIPTPTSGFWPPVPLPTTPMPIVHPSHVDAAADFDRWRVEQLVATFPQESIAALILLRRRLCYSRRGPWLLRQGFSPYRHWQCASY